MRKRMLAGSSSDEEVVPIFPPNRDCFSNHNVALYCADCSLCDKWNYGESRRITNFLTADWMIKASQSNNNSLTKTLAVGRVCLYLTSLIIYRLIKYTSSQELTTKSCL
ncbi:hypothetical protein ANN_21087 [Periplaneta americana]|uniref:Uncharacterized protein n=1 Tax=Periplaneta americana TaxID=6978 RepID=A0ABQ8SEP9_PERAM|nr:hypothetical protein ANN_21087 [Periplaneta americana]